LKTKDVFFFLPEDLFVLMLWSRIPLCQSGWDPLQDMIRAIQFPL